MNKKIILIGITSCIFLAILFLIVFGIKKDKKQVLLSDSFGELSYSGELSNNIPNGKLTIRSKDNKFFMSGTFENGTFKEGMIMVEKGEENIYMEGTFTDLLLQEGKMIITTNTEKIEKRGSFMDNKLNGSGSIQISDNKTGEIKFVYSGKFKNDNPIYK